MTLTWIQVLELLAKWGPEVLPLAEKLWKLISEGKEPTQADWDELNAIAAKTATTKMAAALLKAGIDLNSPNALALLALTK